MVVDYTCSYNTNYIEVMSRRKEELIIVIV